MKPQRLVANGFSLLAQWKVEQIAHFCAVGLECAFSRSTLPMSDATCVRFAPYRKESAMPKTLPATPRIASPGKFEGEYPWVQDAYDAMLNGVADEHSDGSWSIPVDAELRAKYPELRRRQRIRCRETDSGFVVEV